MKFHHATGFVLVGLYLLAVPAVAQCQAGDPPVRGRQILCKQDSDCPGVSRCLNGGRCWRTDMWCKTDAECKYSEICDLTKGEWRAHPIMHFVNGICTPRKPNSATSTAAHPSPSWCSDVPASPPPPHFKPERWARRRKQCIEAAGPYTIMTNTCVSICQGAREMWQRASADAKPKPK
jgi:hypothetical protein